MNLKQLAKELNLSFSTVSKALRDSHEISTQTKNIVLAKAKELNFQVNPLASSFRKQKSNTIAVVIPEVVNGFFGRVINGIESIAQEKGYHVLIYLTHEKMQKEVAISKLLQNGRVDGIIISLSEQTSDTKHLEVLRDNDIPIVFLDRIPDHINAPTVTTDDYNCGIKATQLLVENGCKKIAFLTMSPKLSISNKRMNGYVEALRMNQMILDNSLIVYCSNDDNRNNDLVQNLLKRKNRPDGIFASVEKLAITAYEICAQLKLKIPDDIKIITFSNSYMAGLLNPTLTTITQPAYDIGREAAAIVFKLIEKKANHFFQQNIELNATLVERNSTKAKEKAK